MFRERKTRKKKNEPDTWRRLMCIRICNPIKVCAVKINGNKRNELGQNMLTKLWPSNATGGGVSISIRHTNGSSGCTVCIFPWVWKLVNVNKWSDYLKWNGCPTVMIITIAAWLYIDQHYQRGRMKEEKKWFHVCKMRYVNDEWVVQIQIICSAIEICGQWMWICAWVNENRCTVSTSKEQSVVYIFYFGIQIESESHLFEYIFF